MEKCKHIWGISQFSPPSPEPVLGLHHIGSNLPAASSRYVCISYLPSREMVLSTSFKCCMANLCLSPFPFQRCCQFEPECTEPSDAKEAGDIGELPAGGRGGSGEGHAGSPLSW